MSPSDKSRWINIYVHSGGLSFVRTRICHVVAWSKFNFPLHYAYRLNISGNHCKKNVEEEACCWNTAWSQPATRHRSSWAPANCGGSWGSVPLTVEQHLRLEFEKGHFQYLNFLWIRVLVGNINFGEQRKCVDAWLWINIVHLPMGLFLIYMMSFTLASQDWNVDCITEFFTVLCQSYFAHT